ncbi:MAG: hypothetical protein RIT27_613 [Pseudomonadota bacterium]|jgi:uncharacterized protein (TIGR00255 family)
MLRSMTAFARAAARLPLGESCWEIRSVNHRYLEINLRLPDEWRWLEIPVRDSISRRLSRGKIDCNLKISNSSGEGSFNLNLTLVQHILNAAAQINQLTGYNQPLSPLDILRLPNVLENPVPDADTTKETLLQTLEIALDEMVAYREREGEQILQMLAQRCQLISEEVSKVREQLPLILTAQREKLLNRLGELQQSLSQERLEQEMVFLAQKIDVSEELDRLDAHLIEMKKNLNSTQPIGRRLDFLMQEFHREANTLGSKSAHNSTTLASVNLKVLIEQMREQIQNVE